jgi:hypothetical protein
MNFSHGLRSKAKLEWHKISERFSKQNALLLMNPLGKYGMCIQWNFIIPQT